MIKFIAKVSTNLTMLMIFGFIVLAVMSVAGKSLGFLGAVLASVLFVLIFHKPLAFMINFPFGDEES